MTARSPINTGELLMSLALVALGSYVIYETQNIAETQGFAQVGPRLFPYIIGVGTTLCGAVLGWQSLSGGWRNVLLDQEASTRYATCCSGPRSRHRRSQFSRSASD